MRTITERSWSAELPSGWEARRDNECVTVFRPGGTGALQVSAAFKDALVTDDDLRDFAGEHLRAGARVRDVVVGDFVGFTIAFGTSNRFWRHWYLRSADKMLFVTYNCDLDARETEVESLGQVLGTLRAV